MTTSPSTGCKHEFIDATNTHLGGAVTGGEYCKHCGVIKGYETATPTEYPGHRPNCDYFRNSDHCNCGHATPTVSGIVNRLRGIPIPTQELEDALADFARDEITQLLSSIKEKIAAKRKEPITDDEITDIPFGAQEQERVIGHNAAIDTAIQTIDEHV